MASTDNVKADSCFFHSVYAVLMLIDQDSLRMTYFCRWLLEAGQSLSEPARASVPPAVMDHPAAQASPFYECRSSGSVVPKWFGSWPPSWSHSGQEPAIKSVHSPFFVDCFLLLEEQKYFILLRGEKKCSKGRTIQHIKFKSERYFSF